MTALEALRWVVAVTEFGSIHPREAWGDSSQQIQAYHCSGCSGEFLSRYPDWKKPTRETFPHQEGCKYLVVLALIE